MWYVVEWYTRWIVAPDLAGSNPVVSPICPGGESVNAEDFNLKKFSKVKEKIIVRFLFYHSLYGGERE